MCRCTATPALLIVLGLGGCYWVPVRPSELARLAAERRVATVDERSAEISTTTPLRVCTRDSCDGPVAAVTVRGGRLQGRLADGATLTLSLAAIESAFVRLPPPPPTPAPATAPTFALRRLRCA